MTSIGGAGATPPPTPQVGEGDISASTAAGTGSDGATVEHGQGGRFAAFIARTQGGEGGPRTGGGHHPHVHGGGMHGGGMPVHGGGGGDFPRMHGGGRPLFAPSPGAIAGGAPAGAVSPHVEVGAPATTVVDAGGGAVLESDAASVVVHTLADGGGPGRPGGLIPRGPGGVGLGQGPGNGPAGPGGVLTPRADGTTPSLAGHDAVPRGTLPPLPEGLPRPGAALMGTLLAPRDLTPGAGAAFLPPPPASSETSAAGVPLLPPHEHQQGDGAGWAGPRAGAALGAQASLAPGSESLEAHDLPQLAAMLFAPPPGEGGEAARRARGWAQDPALPGGAPRPGGPSPQAAALLGSLRGGLADDPAAAARAILEAGPEAAGEALAALALEGPIDRMLATELLSSLPEDAQSTLIDHLEAALPPEEREAVLASMGVVDDGAPATGDAASAGAPESGEWPGAAGTATGAEASGASDAAASAEGAGAPEDAGGAGSATTATATTAEGATAEETSAEGATSTGASEGSAGAEGAEAKAGAEGAGAKAGAEGAGAKAGAEGAGAKAGAEGVEAKAGAEGAEGAEVAAAAAAAGKGAQAAGAGAKGVGGKGEAAATVQAGPGAEAAGLRGKAAGEGKIGLEGRGAAGGKGGDIGADAEKLGAAGGARGAAGASGASAALRSADARAGTLSPQAAEVRQMLHVALAARMSGGADASAGALGAAFGGLAKLLKGGPEDACAVIDDCFAPKAAYVLHQHERRTGEGGAGDGKEEADELIDAMRSLDFAGLKAVALERAASRIAGLRVELAASGEPAEAEALARARTQAALLLASDPIGVARFGREAPETFPRTAARSVMGELLRASEAAVTDALAASLALLLRPGEIGSGAHKAFAAGYWCGAGASAAARIAQEESIVVGVAEAEAAGRALALAAAAGRLLAQRLGPSPGGVADRDEALRTLDRERAALDGAIGAAARGDGGFSEGALEARKLGGAIKAALASEFAAMDPDVDQDLEGELLAGFRSAGA